MGHALIIYQSSRLFVVGVCSGITRVLKFLLGVHLNGSAMEAGTAANYAEECKDRKYAALAEAHQFESIAVEMMGVYGVTTRIIMRANRPPPC